MPTRYQQLVDALQGYQQTGVPLVAAHGGRMYPAGFGDDAGMYYFIPRLAALLGLPLDRAIDLFFIGVAALSVVVAVTGLFLLYRQGNQRAVAIVVVSATSVYAFMTGDVYMVSFFFAVAAVPWALYATRKPEPYTTAYLFFPVITFLLAIVNTVRSHAGTGVLLFLIALLLAPRGNAGKKAAIILLMLVTALAPVLFFKHVVHARNTYLKQQEAAPELEGHHPFWHSAYIGLGFINNPYVGSYRDEVAIDKVKSIDPKAVFLSSRYSEILKQETISIVREHPKFILMNLAAKAGVIFFILMLFMNLGLPAACVWRKPPHVDVAFWAGISFNALFGLIVMPSPNYLSGFIAFASLYCIVSVNYGLDGRSVRMFIQGLFRGIRSLCAA